MNGCFLFAETRYQTRVIGHVAWVEVRAATITSCVEVQCIVRTNAVYLFDSTRTRSISRWQNSAIVIPYNNLPIDEFASD